MNLRIFLSRYFLPTQFTPIGLISPGGGFFFPFFDSVTSLHYLNIAKGCSTYPFTKAYPSTLKDSSLLDPVNAVPILSVPAALFFIKFTVLSSTVALPFLYLALPASTVEISATLYSPY